MSSHTFVTGILITSGVWVFVIVNECSAVFSSIVGGSLYPTGTGFSTTLYSIATPSEYTGKPVNSSDQLFVLLNVNVFSGTTTPFANNCTVTDWALTPSWSFASSQSFVTGILINSGSAENCIVSVNVVLSISAIGCSSCIVIGLDVSSPYNHKVFVVL